MILDQLQADSSVLFNSAVQRHVPGFQPLRLMLQHALVQRMIPAMQTVSSTVTTTDRPSRPHLDADQLRCSLHILLLEGLCLALSLPQSLLRAGCQLLRGQAVLRRAAELVHNLLQADATIVVQSVAAFGEHAQLMHGLLDAGAHCLRAVQLRQDATWDSGYRLLLSSLHEGTSC